MIVWVKIILTLLFNQFSFQSGEIWGVITEEKVITITAPVVVVKWYNSEVAFCTQQTIAASNNHLKFYDNW